MNYSSWLLCGALPMLLAWNPVLAAGKYPDSGEVLMKVVMSGVDPVYGGMSAWVTISGKAWFRVYLRGIDTQTAGRISREQWWDIEQLVRGVDFETQPVMAGPLNPGIPTVSLTLYFQSGRVYSKTLSGSESAQGFWDAIQGMRSLHLENPQEIYSGGRRGDDLPSPAF